MDIGTWLKNNRHRFPEKEASLLLSLVLKREKSFILAHPEHILTAEEEKILDAYRIRRGKHEPLAYITGEKEFFGLPFFVTPATLIPRPETEILVEYVLGGMKNMEYGIWNGEKEKTISLIDIGTGSGCIPISIMVTLQETHPKLFPHIQCLAVDISPDAIEVAKQNAKRHHVANDISFQKSDLLSGAPNSYFQAPFFILTANLPYLSEEIYQSSPEDVRLYEPQGALQGDTTDGTALMRELLRQCQEKITQAHFIILEISPEQGSSLLTYGKDIFPQREITLLPDLSGRARFLVIQNHP